jgi:hypothetical protein
MPTKILAIDDSKTMRLAIKITFAAEDCEVVAVSKGSEAVARAKQMPADVLIVDAVLAAGEPSGIRGRPPAARRPGDRPHPGADPGLQPDRHRRGPGPGQRRQRGDDQALRHAGAAREGQRAGLGQERADQAAAPASRRGAATYSATASTSAPRRRSRRSPRPTPAAPVRLRAAKPATRHAARARGQARSRPRRPSAALLACPLDSASHGRKCGQGQRLPAAFTSVEDMASKIPIAVPIPFASAGATRPRACSSACKPPVAAASGLDPKAVEALLALSRDVVEQVVWEVVPDLAEHALKQAGLAKGPHHGCAGSRARGLASFCSRLGRV